MRYIRNVLYEYLGGISLSVFETKTVEDIVEAKYSELKPY